MNIREATVDDIPDIRKITLDAYSIYSQDSPLPWYNEKNIGSIKDYEARYFSDPAFITFVVEDEGKIIGFAICAKSIDKAFKLNPRFFAGRKPLYIFDIGVSRSVQGKGVGSELFDYIVAWAKFNKFGSVVLNTQAGSVAHKWYEKLGFKQIAAEVFLEKKLK